jgi:hypothetical protein
MSMDVLSLVCMRAEGQLLHHTYAFDTSGERACSSSFGIARILSLLHCVKLLYINP